MDKICSWAIVAVSSPDKDGCASDRDPDEAVPMAVSVGGKAIFIDLSIIKGE